MFDEGLHNESPQLPGRNSDLLFLATVLGEPAPDLGCGLVDTDEA